MPLSKQISPRQFGLVRGHILTTNRRFQKMGRWRIARMFMNTALNSWNDRYLLQDQNYWKECS